MQHLQTNFATLFNNVRNNHNDRKNDTLLYYTACLLFMITWSCAIYTAPVLVTNTAPIVLTGILVFFIAMMGTLHWYQCLSARYFSPSGDDTHQHNLVLEVTEADLDLPIQ